MNWKQESKSFLFILGFFLATYLMPLGSKAFDRSILAAFELLKWYAKEHVILCLIPAFFIAGAISVYVSQSAVIKYFGADSPKWLSYSIAAVSGSILAVCSCTVLPLFSGIHKRGAGLGPAISFLYSGPAINILAIILTARILGFELGVARVIGAVGFSVVIGLVMSWLFNDEEGQGGAMIFPEEESEQSMGQMVFHLTSLVLILVFANWAKPEEQSGLWWTIFQWKWPLTSLASGALAFSLVWVIKLPIARVAIAAVLVGASSFLLPGNPLVPFVVGVVALSILLSMGKYHAQGWISSSWGFTKQILPLLAMGVLLAGFLLGHPGSNGGIIPAAWISGFVGGNSLAANFFASIAGALMYFATLTEIPILQGLIQSGMGKGPALALLLAGPALSLPNMLVINGVIGSKKTGAYIGLVVVMATFSGYLYGSMFG